MGVAFDAARIRYSEVQAPPTKEFDLVASEPTQRYTKLRAFDTGSVVDLKFVGQVAFLQGHYPENSVTELCALSCRITTF
jgi:hypothetical protein